MQDRGAWEEYVACPSRLLIKEICSTWHLMRQVDYQLVLYRFLPVCNMQVEFLRKLCYVKIQSAWIHSRSGNRFRDHVATKTLHDTFIIYVYTICTCMGVLSTLGLESEEISLFFKHMFFFRNEIREPQQGLVLSPPAVSRRCNWSSSHKDHRSSHPPLDRWPSVVWRT